jgi:hypothetical protein
MEYGWVISICCTAGGLLAQAAYLKGVFGTKIAEHDRRIDEIVDKTVFRDSCKPRHEEIERRFCRLEKLANGRLGE